MHTNLRFIPATLGDKTAIDSDDLIHEFAEAENRILKLDIEGSEHKVLNELQNDSKFDAIVVDFHYLHN